MVEAEPAIRQLLKLDFEPKVEKTIRQVFRQSINQTIKSNLLPMGQTIADEILQQYNVARANLEETLQQEAEEKIAYNNKLMSNIQDDCLVYNEAVKNINQCLEIMCDHEHQLPLIPF